MRGPEGEGEEGKKDVREEEIRRERGMVDKE